MPPLQCLTLKEMHKLSFGLAEAAFWDDYFPLGLGMETRFQISPVSKVSIPLES